MTGTASSTTPDSRQPSASAISNVTDKRRDEQVLQKFVGFVFGGLAIIARDGDVQIVWKHVAAQSSRSLSSTRSEMTVAFVPLRLESVMVTAGYSASPCCPVAPLEHWRTARKCPARLGRPRFLRYVAQVDGASGVNPDHDLSQFVALRKEVAGFDLKLPIVARKTAGLAAAVRALSCATIAPGVRP